MSSLPSPLSTVRSGAKSGLLGDISRLYIDFIMQIFSVSPPELAQAMLGWIPSHQEWKQLILGGAWEEGGGADHIGPSGYHQVHLCTLHGVSSAPQEVHPPISWCRQSCDQLVLSLLRQSVSQVSPCNQNSPCFRFVLECRGDGDPAPTYRWFRNSQLLTDELLAQQDIEEMSDGEHSELHFSSPTAEHEGYYHCEAENSLGRARSSNTLVAPTFPSPPPGTSPPHFTEAPRTELQSLGSKVELVCKASGDPRPDITWTKNGKILETKTDTLVIPSLGQEDVANYACNASNIAGYEYKNVILSILTMKPRIKEGPKDYHAGSKGSNITLKCEAEGYPQPVITWTRDGQPVVEGERFHVDRQTGDLTVTQASTKDDGRSVNIESIGQLVWLGFG